MTDRRTGALVTGVATAVAAASVACAQSVPNYDFQWATVGDLNNGGYDGPTPFGLKMLLGRGSVDYTYRISKLEVTTSQWMEFVNTYSTRGDEWRFFGEPTFWGAVVDPSYQGPGRRYSLRTDVANAGMLPVVRMTWRDSAMFCNWLNNDKAPTLEAIANGAYDISTFGQNPDGTFTDQAVHNPDAKFWIPTLDEWMKAVRFDPNRMGEGQGGWWQYPNMSDEPPIPGRPEDGGTTSAGYTDLEIAFGEWDIPLGAYADYMSAYGLWDTSGAGSEWIEDYINGQHRERIYLGSFASGEYVVEDHSSVAMSSQPDSAGTMIGFRIASQVPEPASAATFLFGCSLIRRKRSS